ncbi:hypothetical protein [Streptomyces sp. UH6]|uniref:hypothetical protein n=1 Tax=Streptomyces sp. UH6 TaxID=2748379 RepID=UPI0015D4D56F|nr:hypothetical protein [Streptomyces sp. UH6]NYV75457.1 hypothetical protein [Streptomyces sp. UH6]
MGEAEAARAYGRYPELLPEFVRDARGEDGRQVVVLRWEESQELARLSLSRFPAWNSVSLDWSAVPPVESVEWDDGAGFAAVLRRYGAGADAVVVFWGDLSVPTVVMPVDVAVRRAAELWDVGPEFWTYPLDGDVLVEARWGSPVVVGRIPSDPAQAPAPVP